MTVFIHVNQIESVYKIYIIKNNNAKVKLMN